MSFIFICFAFSHVYNLLLEMTLLSSSVCTDNLSLTLMVNGILAMITFREWIFYLVTVGNAWCLEEQ